jgi:DnaJ-class molecular chaperone
MSPYEVLGVAEDAAAEDIRRAYVALARRHHPDFYLSSPPARRAEAERRMQAINEAWSVLGDEERRRAYDRSRGRHDPEAEAGAARGFRPFDGDDDDVDPRDLPDEPYAGGRAQESLAARAGTLAPVAAFGLSIVLGALGLVVGQVALLALAAAAFLLACLGFIVLPLVALSRASRNN